MICEHDIDDPLLSHGAIIFEQYTGDAEDEVMERARGFANSGKYGRVWIGKVAVQFKVPVDNGYGEMAPMIIAERPD